MAVTAEQVKALRERTGAGFMDCKQALTETNGDLEKAVDLLRAKGVNVALKREGKAAQEGTIAAYVHAGNQIGVLVDLRCETDFVGRTDDFREVARDLAMQVAAMHPRWVGPDDVPVEVLDRERGVLREQAESEGKPEHIVERMVEGRLAKFYEENCLLEQPFIKDDSMKVRDRLNELIAACGEKIVVARFARYQVGEDE